MKHFIYYDERLLASYYAQAFGGLTTLRQEMFGDSTENTMTDGEANYGSEVKGKVSAIVAKAEGTLKAEIKSPTASFSESQMAQELVTSSMHDNIFDRVIAHAKENDLIKNEDQSISDYMSIEIPLMISDLDEMIKKFSNTAFQPVLKKGFQDNVYEASDSTNPNMTAESWEKERRKIAKKQGDIELDSMMQSIELINGVVKILPLKTFIFGESSGRSIIIPTKEENFREPLDYITTFMEGNIHVFGRVSRFGMSSNLQGNLGTLKKVLDEFSQKMISELCNMPVDENTIILYPMAIYF